MASPGKIPTFAWNGLDTISPRLEGSRPPQALRICTGLGKPFPPSCTLFLSAAGLGALLPRTVRQRYGTNGKTPNGFGGLDPWRWAILETVRLNRREKIYPFQDHASPPKTSGVCVHPVYRFSNGCHTVSKYDSAGKFCQVSTPTPKKPKT